MAMIRIFANRVEDGARTLHSVPQNIRSDVESLVISEGYEFDSDGYAHKVEENN